MKNEKDWWLFTDTVLFFTSDKNTEDHLKQKKTLRYKKENFLNYKKVAWLWFKRPITSFNNT